MIQYVSELSPDSGFTIVKSELLISKLFSIIASLQESLIKACGYDIGYTLFIVYFPFKNMYL